MDRTWDRDPDDPREDIFDSYTNYDERWENNHWVERTEASRTHVTNSEQRFREWFPEISHKLFENLRTLKGITMTMDSGKDSHVYFKWDPSATRRTP